MSDGAFCHYCRKAVCVCDEKEPFRGEEMKIDEIRTPVTYEPVSKAIYQANGFGIVASIKDFTVTDDDEQSAGSDKCDQICDKVGYYIADAINAYARKEEK